MWTAAGGTPVYRYMRKKGRECEFHLLTLSTGADRVRVMTSTAHSLVLALATAAAAAAHARG